MAYSIDKFNASLNHTLLCSNDLSAGLIVRRKRYALTQNYIQCNDLFIKFLVIDIDQSNSYWLWDDSGLPAPNIIAKNPDNGHCHYIYALSTPIVRTDLARLRPLAYFAKIQQAYISKLKADPHYVNLITKNPNITTKWTVSFLAKEPYTLDYLADFVDLPDKITKKEAVGEGRNCFLFDSVRKIAYREVLFYKKNQATLNDFYNYLMARLEKLNYFENSPKLPVNELTHIAKSVAKWTWRNFSEQDFSEIQKKRNHRRKSFQRTQIAIQEAKNALFS